MKRFIEQDNYSINAKSKLKQRYTFSILILICLVIVFSYGVGNASAASGNTIYVNGSSGNDAHNGTTWLLAKKSIKNATETVNAGGTVHIANGIYSGSKNNNIEIDKSMNIEGQSETGTIINGTNSQQIFYIVDGKVTLTDLTITNSKSDDGAIYDGTPYTLTVDNCAFKNNNGTSAGSSIFTYSSLRINKCTFSNNYATDYGTIDDQEGSVTVITNSIFNNNYAGVTGGAISSNGLLTVKDSIFNGNSAISGGAIESYSGSMTITESNFTNNIALSGDGGAICTNNCSLTANTCNFINNHAITYGGAIANDKNATANVNYNRFIGNTAGVLFSTITNIATINADYNWWGDNSGPATNMTDFKINKWLVLTVSANPTTVQTNTYSKVSADLRYDNNGALNIGTYLPSIKTIYATTLGTISNSTIFNGFTQANLISETTGTANVSVKVDNQILYTSVKVIDAIPPKLIKTNPTNGQIKFPTTGNIAITFSEKIKTSSNWSKIVMKDKYGHTQHITCMIIGNTILIKTNKKARNSWYTVTIPASAVKDYSGNNFKTSYTFKFKTAP